MNSFMAGLALASLGALALISLGVENSAYYIAVGVLSAILTKDVKG